MRLDLDLTLTRPSFRLAAQGSFALSGVTTLFGPSGSGKTTLLRLIAGFEPEARGSLKLDGEEWMGRPPHALPVGYVFQDARLFPHLSVERNLLYAWRRAPRDGSPIAWEEVVSRMDLGPLLKRRPETLSGGERQRVAIGRALLTRPRLMLMDEPLSALDRARKAAILPLIADLPRRFGIPVLYVTHAVEEALRLSEGLILMRDGEIYDSGPPLEVFARVPPAALGPEVESGAALEGRAGRYDPDYQILDVDLGGGTLLRVPVEAAPPEGAPLRLRIAAADVALARLPLADLAQGDISIRNALPVRIQALEATGGPFVEARLALEGGGVLRARLTRLAAAEMDLKEGEAVFALVKAAALDSMEGPGPSA
ncbi:molybdenum ABC transporter ATP-binding protein [Neomegalonema sp.]|uniref:molybdenum ABC transporter ATP-binding protein n=1 Tax=Neomegalonema sp. TaxID=2039713 RepID=UPI00262DC3A1|nr:molybdenum ABC transporter ATP-binding protein [Neomegalonema sp.]MDD2867845.1 molybdenum ABC transporter ATP-binding protein [Neomegalonema sp.]